MIHGSAKARYTKNKKQLETDSDQNVPHSFDNYSIRRNTSARSKNRRVEYEGMNLQRDWQLDNQKKTKTGSKNDNMKINSLLKVVPKEVEISLETTPQKSKKRKEFSPSKLFCNNLSCQLQSALLLPCDGCKN